MALEAIPTEILEEICSYNTSDSLSVTNKYIRSVALKFVLETIRLTAIDDKFEAVFKFSQNPENSCLIRKVILDNKWPDDRFEPRLITIFESLKSLKAIQCSEQVAAALLDGWGSFPNYELSIDKFELSGNIEGPAYQHGSKFRLLSLPRLKSLRVIVSAMLGRRSSDDSATTITVIMRRHNRYLGDAVLFLTGICKNLKSLNLSHRHSDRPITLPRVRPCKASLQQLSFSGVRHFDPEVFQIVQKATDLDKLERLFLPINYSVAHDWLGRHGMSFKRLKILCFLVPRGNHWEEIMMTRIINFLHSLPPLEVLDIHGPYQQVIPVEVLDHHNTLKSLLLHDPPIRLSREIAAPIMRNQFERIVQLRCLHKLKIQLARCNEESWNIWHLLRSSSVSSLILTLDPYTNLESIDQSPSPIRRRTFLQNAALDENLARSIYEYCELDTLEVSVQYQGFDGFTSMTRAEYGDHAFILAEIARSYMITRVYGQVVVQRIGATPPNLVQPDHTSQFMTEFRALWPPKAMGDWWTDWSSKPFVVVID